MNKQLWNEEGPFLSQDGLLFYILRSAFQSENLSASLLSEATGVGIDLCISFCAASLSAIELQEEEEEEL